MGTPGSVIVVGGEPAGALLVFLLARGGMPTTLIGRSTRNLIQGVSDLRLTFGRPGT